MNSGYPTINDQILSDAGTKVDTDKDNHLSKGEEAIELRTKVDTDQENHLNKRVEVLELEEDADVINCDECADRFTTGLELRNHILSAHSVNTLNCDDCEEQFTIDSDLRDHIKSVHKTTTISNCNICDKSIGCAITSIVCERSCRKSFHKSCISEFKGKMGCKLDNWCCQSCKPKYITTEVNVEEVTDHLTKQVAALNLNAEAVEFVPSNKDEKSRQKLPSLNGPQKNQMLPMTIQRFPFFRVLLIH